jgi:hypothetical protein
MKLTAHGSLTDKDVQRFSSKIVIGDVCLCQNTPHVCWIWNARTTKAGDGSLRLNNTSIKAQDFAFIAQGNSLSNEQSLRRICSTKNCCNPECMVLYRKRILLRKHSFRAHYTHAASKAMRYALQPGSITRREWLRFLHKIVEEGTCQCTGSFHKHWLWQPVLHVKGYGQFLWRGRIYPAHRFSVIALGQVIPEGYEPDHVCRIRHCVNPACIEIVTKKENRLRGNSLPAKNARKTHCHRGHLLSDEHLVPGPLKRNERCCRICTNARSRERYALQKKAKEELLTTMF